MDVFFIIYLGELRGDQGHISDHDDKFATKLYSSLKSLKINILRRQD